MKVIRRQSKLSFASLILLVAVIHLTKLPALSQSTITTYAGGGVAPVDGGFATTQSFDETRSVISDGAGGFYFASAGLFHQSIYRVAADGRLTVIAGADNPGFDGDGGPARNAYLNYPRGLALDAVGNLFVADSKNHRIRKITPTGFISTVAGNGSSGYGGDGSVAAAAQLSLPDAVAVDGSGNLYIADTGNHRIRKVAADGIISTLAGTGSPGFSGDGGPGTSARLMFPVGIAVDISGNVFFADSGNFRVRKISAGGVITTVVGTGTPRQLDGPLASGELLAPRDVALDTNGNLVIADGNRIRQTNATTIFTFAGRDSTGFSGDGGPAINAFLNYPSGVAVEAGGGILIADALNYRIRRVTSQPRIITTVAGNGSYGYGGDAGPASSAMLNYPGSVVADSAGNTFIADTWNNRIRVVTPDGTIRTFAGNGAASFSGDGGLALLAGLNHPTSVTVDPSGNVYIAECNNRIRKVSPNGIISTFSGGAAWGFCGYIPPGGLRANYFSFPDLEYIEAGGLAADAIGNLFVSDTINNRIYKIAPNGIINLVAGSSSGFGGDGGPALNAHLAYPHGIAVDGSGNIFIADTGNYRVRKITPDGVINTVAGNGTLSFSGDGGPAILAALYPTSVAVDALNNLFIGDPLNFRVRRVTMGIIRTIAGSETAGFGGDGGLSTSAQLNSPSGIAVNSAGDLFIADTNNHRIRKLRLVRAAPTLTSISPDIGAPGTTVQVVLAGTNFENPLAVSTGTGITVNDVRILANGATATLTIAPDASMGFSPITVTSDLGTSGEVGFNIVPPFPNLSIRSSHAAESAVGSNTTYAVGITNVGAAATNGPLTVTDVLPSGLDFVSGTGSGWSCSASNQTVTCTNPLPLSAGDSTELLLTVIVGTEGPSVVHSPVVEVDGDLIPSNNTASDLTWISTPVLSFNFGPAPPTAGKTGKIGLALLAPFPQDVSGTLRITFASYAAIPLDDPAIQFISGGREIAFTIPANTRSARFNNSQSNPLAFQSGSVAGTLTFTATLTTGSFTTTQSRAHEIPRDVPFVQSFQRQTAGIPSFVVTLLSTMREVTQLHLRFSTTPSVQLNCGKVSGCSVSGTAITLDVKQLFDEWFSRDTTFGGLSTLRLPFRLEGSARGSVYVTLRNSLGASNPISLVLP